MSGLMGCICVRESVHCDGRKFSLHGRLGEGGFSYVDLVEDASTKKKFALKRITCHSEEDQKLALEEVEYMRTLDHPNLVALETSDTQRLGDNSRGVISEVFIVMPYYRRGTIHDEFDVFKAQGSHIELPRVLRLFRGICAGLSYLHNLKPTPLAHRDIKPANVLVTDEDSIILMDFGSMGPARVEIQTSQQARQLQDMAAERCSMPYRAPELFNVENHSMVDERVDIWSLGCTLYAICYHESPYDQTYAKGGSIALAVLSDHVKFPSDDPFTPELHDLIHMMMVVNAMERPYIDAVINRVDTMQQNDQNRV